MKIQALLLKDLYNLRKQAKLVLLILIFYNILGFISKQNLTFGAMMVVFCGILSISTFSYDQYCKWDNYALSLPCTRRDLVLSKYILALLLIVAGVALVLGFHLLCMLIIPKNLAPLKLMLLTVGSAAGVCIFMISILYPVIWKLGVEKARTTLFVLAFLPVFGLYGASKIGLALPTKETLSLLAWLSPLSLLVLLLLSVFLSIKIANNRDY